MSTARKPPFCPKCRQPMKLGHVTPKFASHPEITVFECRSCGELITQTQEPGADTPRE